MRVGFEHSNINYLIRIMFKVVLSGVLPYPVESSIRSGLVQLMVNNTSKQLEKPCKAKTIQLSVEVHCIYYLQNELHNFNSRINDGNANTGDRDVRTSTLSQDREVFIGTLLPHLRLDSLQNFEGTCLYRASTSQLNLLCYCLDQPQTMCMGSTYNNISIYIFEPPSTFNRLLSQEKIKWKI